MKHISFIILITISQLLFAQEIEISGQIKDKSTKNTIEYASIVVLSPKDSIITGGVTNGKGFFTIPVKSGSYKVICSYIGYNNDTLILTNLSANHYLGTIKLTPNIAMLKEATVVSSSRETQIDKDVFIVTDSIKKGTSDAKELMEKINGVSYDRYNNSIKVDNENNVVFLVNGLEKNAEYIQNLSPDRIKKIEVIRDPSGRYALEGYSAIINILLKTNYRGTELFAQNMMLFDSDNKVLSQLIPMDNVYLSYNYTYNKVNIYGQLRNHYINFNINSETTTKTDDYSIIETNTEDNDKNTNVINLNTNATIGIDYYINPKNTISYEANVSAFPYNESRNSNKYLTSVIKDGNTIDSYTYSSDNISQSKSFYNSFFYVGKLSENDELNINFTYSNYNSDYTNIFNQSNVLLHTETGNNNKQFTKTYAEINHSFNKKATIQVGYGNTWKGITTNFYSEENNLINATNTLSNQNFTSSELRHKAYSYFSYKFTKKLSLKTGIATEVSERKDDSQNNKYTIYQPHLDLLFNQSKNLKVKLKYRAYSNYPSISETNPFTNILDANTISRGNLRCEKSYYYEKTSPFFYLF